MKKMNKAVKIILSLIIGLIVFLFLAVGILILCLDPILKKGISTFGSQMTGAKVEVTSVSVSLWSSKVEVTGLVVGNPAGYSSPEAFHLQRLYVSLDRNSLFTDKIIVHQITIEGTKINFEPKLNGDSNLSTIRKNIERQMPPSDTKKEVAPPQTKEPATPRKSKKIVIELFELRNAQIAVSSSLFQGAGVNLLLPDITMRDIGKNEDITSAEAFERIFKSIFKGVTDAVSGVTDAIPLQEGVNKVQEEAKGAVEKTTESGKKLMNGLKSLF